MAGLAIITEACIDVKDRACVDVCPVQCIYEFDPQKNVLFSEEQAGNGVIENSHTPSPEAVAIFGDMKVPFDRTRSIKALSITSACLKSAITPFFKGMPTRILPGVRPNISLASLPTACTSPVMSSRATAEGSLTTMPLPRA